MRQKEKPFLQSFGPVIQIIVFIAVVGFLVFLLYPGLQELEQLKLREVELDAKITSIQEETRQLYREFKALANDPDYVEKVARDNLGYGEQGEIVYRFDESKVSPSTSALKSSGPVPAGASSANSLTSDVKGKEKEAQVSDLYRIER